MEHRLSTALRVNFRPEGYGFWYGVSGSPGVRYWFSFITVGAGGHQLQGEISGTLEESEDWNYSPVHFAVVHVGASEVEIVPNGSTTPHGESAPAVATAESPPAVATIARDAAAAGAVGSLQVPSRPPTRAGEGLYAGTPPYNL